MGLIERMFGWLGIVADTDVRDNPDEYIKVDPIKRLADAGFTDLAAQLASQPKVGVDDCPHITGTGIDNTPIEDPDKKFRCDDCGLVYRYIVDPKKPWLIRAYAPVGVSR